MILELQNRALELLAAGTPLGQTLDRLCREVEQLVPDALCSVLSVDRDGRLHSLAAPSLPAAFVAGIDGAQIGPEMGSCGRAAHIRQPVLVSDIATDPLWDGFREAALSIGIRACWSNPICKTEDEVIGTFALYYREPRQPTELEEQVAAACVRLCAIAIDRDNQHREVDRLIYRDTLTGLGNRACFNEAAAQCDAVGGTCALLMLDVNDLKVINDLFGHRAGDRLLCVVADRMADAVHDGRAFRLGGDEFALILEGVDVTVAEEAAVAVLAALERPTDCDGHMLVPTATIGIAVRRPGEAFDAVRQNADLALYHAKETARGRFVRHVDGMGTAITRRMQAIRSTREALEEGRIEPFYQPLLDLSTRRIIGLEALCRIRLPRGVVLPAAEFHEATSDAHVAVAITRRMLAKMAVDARRWVEEGVSFRLVGINLSPADFHSGGVADHILHVLDGTGVPPDALVVEVTESVYLGRRDDVVAREIGMLRDHGMRVALDDFGTGFASLSHLLSMPIDILKIDKRFVDQLEHDAAGAAIINGIARIAEKLGIDVVAEGVQTEEQCRLLVSLGVNVGQGYLLARPMDAADTTAFLRGRAAMPSPTLPTAFSRYDRSRAAVGVR